MGTHSPHKTARQVWANGRMAALGLAKRNGAKLTTFHNQSKTAMLCWMMMVVCSLQNSTARCPLANQKQGQAVTEKVKADAETVVKACEHQH